MYLKVFSVFGFADLPNSEGPDIRGEKKRYHTGDMVRVNCSSSRSRPAASLAWFINQEPVQQYY